MLNDSKASYGKVNAFQDLHHGMECHPDQCLNEAACLDMSSTAWATDDTTEHSPLKYVTYMGTAAGWLACWLAAAGVGTALAGQSR